MTNKNTNWYLCFICQKSTKESFRSMCNRRKNLDVILSKFESKNPLDFDINRIRCGDKKFMQKLQQNQASYHPSCKNKYNNGIFERELQATAKKGYGRR